MPFCVHDNLDRNVELINIVAGVYNMHAYFAFIGRAAIGSRFQMRLANDSNIRIESNKNGRMPGRNQYDI